MSKCQNKVEAVNCLKSDRKIFVRNNAKSCQFETDTQRKLTKVHWEKLFPPNKKTNASYCRDRDIRTCYWSHGYHKNNNKSFLSIWRSSNDPGTDAPEKIQPSSSNFKQLISKSRKSTCRIMKFVEYSCKIQKIKDRFRSWGAFIFI